MAAWPESLRAVEVAEHADDAVAGWVERTHVVAAAWVARHPLRLAACARHAGALKQRRTAVSAWIQKNHPQSRHRSEEHLLTHLQQAIGPEFDPVCCVRIRGKPVGSCAEKVRSAFEGHVLGLEAPIVLERHRLSGQPIRSECLQESLASASRPSRMSQSSDAFNSVSCALAEGIAVAGVLRRRRFAFTNRC